MYREAGPQTAPTIVLLHWFSSSSRGYNTLISLLATRYHVVAPDFPSFGQSDMPSPEVYSDTFDHRAALPDAEIHLLNAGHFALVLCHSKMLGLTTNLCDGGCVL